MTERRCYIRPEQAGNAYFELDAAEAQHVSTVLRLGIGARLVAFDGQGRTWPCVVAQVGRHSVRLEPAGDTRLEPPSRVTIVLLQAMLKSDAMDGVVRQATELGANRIVPLVSARSVPVLDGPRLERRIERWRRIATDACRQSERSWLPVIEAPVDLGKVVLPARSLAGVERSGRPLVEAVAAIANVAELGLLIGPEGGWTEDERSSLAAAGVTAVSLGRHILRAGTAAVAALAVVLARVSWSEHAD